MLIVSSSQAFKRWDLLPELLREAAVNDVNADIIWQTCRDEHLPEEKIYTVSRLAGYVLFGFLHPEELAKEIAERLALHPNIASSISDSLNRKLFAPLRGEIDRVYAPPGRDPESAWQVPLPVGEEATSPTPLILEEVSGQGGTTPTMSIREIPAPSPSMQSQHAAPPPPPPPGATPSWPFASSKISEESGRGTPPAPPGPLILHEETPASASKRTSSFKLDVPLPQYKTTKEREAPALPARLEMGEAKPPSPSGETPPGGEKPKVVHYSDWRTPVQIPGASKPPTPTPPPLPRAEANQPPVSLTPTPPEVFMIQPQIIAPPASPAPAGGTVQPQGASVTLPSISFLTPTTPLTQPLASQASAQPRTSPPSSPPAQSVNVSFSTAPPSPNLGGHTMPRGSSAELPYTTPPLNISTEQPVTVRTEETRIIQESKKTGGLGFPKNTVNQQSTLPPTLPKTNTAGAPPPVSINVAAPGGTQAGGGPASVYIIHEPQKPPKQPPVPHPAPPRPQVGTPERPPSAALSWSEARRPPFQPSAANAHQASPPIPAPPEKPKEINPQGNQDVVDLSVLKKTSLSATPQAPDDSSVVNLKKP